MVRTRVGDCVGIVACAEVDAALGRRLIGSCGSAEHRAPELRILGLQLGRCIRSAELRGVSARTVAALLAHRGDAPLAACAYEDGRGHPFWFARSMVGELAALHGDKGVWKLLDRHGEEVVEVPVDGPIPHDVDTWEDYQSVLTAR